MRLDKFVGKAIFKTKISICDWRTTEELYYLPDGELFLEIEKELKQYKVRSYEVDGDILYLYVKKKED
jgi:hypothetical protein